MNMAEARILNLHADALRTAASAARMSTQAGTALEIYDRSEPEKDLRLIGKVMASGHMSVIEHLVLSVAMNNVSVFAEQFFIRFRLASFTVKSRRYVDFSDAGTLTPDVPDGFRAAWQEDMQRCVDAYQRLMELGVPKEDARFVLPYSLRSNFFMTVNARELMYMISEMLCSPWRRYAELRQIGQQLKAQMDAAFPGLMDGVLARQPEAPFNASSIDIREGAAVPCAVRLLSSPANPMDLLETVSERSGLREEALLAALRRSGARELELLNYVFEVDGISLACLTHFSRHRMQSPMIPDVADGIAKGNYVLPQTVADVPEAEEIYRGAFARQAAAARRALDAGCSPELMAYYSMSGHTVKLTLGMNARELLHFGKLRTCRRAQWEIQIAAKAMLGAARERFPALFDGYGPSCAVTGRCPEGRMSCGRPMTSLWETE